jgi:hypothetical protein
MQTRMVSVATAKSAFEAKVLAARLGADGVLWEVRGSIDGMYPVGTIEILVDVDDLERAMDILSIGELESDEDELVDPRSRQEWLLFVGVGLLTALFLVVRILGGSV